MLVWLLYLVTISASGAPVVTMEATYTDASTCYHMARAMSYGTQRAACVEGRRV
jgi:hypothetical protein